MSKEVSSKGMGLMEQLLLPYLELKDLLFKISKGQLAPLAAQIDEEGEIPSSVISTLAEQGILGIFTPEEFGGAGMDYVAYALAVDILSQTCASTGVLLSAHCSLGTWPILSYGTLEQKNKYLPLLASGKAIGCFCLSEPNAGSDPASLETYAVDKGSYYEIQGTKNFITNGKEASLAIVFAKTDRALSGSKGISCFIVDARDPAFKRLKYEDKLGIRGSSTAQIALDKIQVPKENLLGNLGDGLKIALSTLDGGRLGIAAQALGIAKGAYEYALKYSLQRKQFGNSISSFQAIQFMLADMSTAIKAGELLILEGSFKKNAKQKHTLESAQAKLFCSEAAMKITTQAIQILGGAGYTREYPVERFFRDAKITEIYEGTSEIQRLVIAANELKKYS